MTEHIDALLTLGSNIEPERHMPAAVRALRRSPRIVVQRVSPLYWTPPVGTGDDRPFLNGAARITTTMGIRELRDELRRIEEACGRVRSDDKYAPRTIDIDIAYYGDLVLDEGGITVPDPGVAEHAHLAVPLADIAPEWVDPKNSLTIRDLVLKLPAVEREFHIMTAQPLIPLETGGRYAVELEAVGDEVYSPRYESLVRNMLLEIGEDPDREGLARTPLRVAKAMDFLTSGYTTTLEEVVNEAIFEEAFEEMVVVKDIEFYSMCEHHMLPFFGKAAVGYLPNGKIIGLSKIARIVDLFARRLQVQERLTNQIADALVDVLGPHGVAVVMEGSHFCMMMRGVQKQSSSMVTSAMRGTFNENARSRSEFMEHIKD